MKAPKLKPSLQQAAFYDWVRNGTGSCVLEAVAGAGKTTTLIEALSLMSGRIFFGAFSKNIATEIEGRTGIRNGLLVSTMHAAGMRAWRNVAEKFMKVDADKCRNLFRELTFRQIDYAVLEGPVLQLVSLAKQAAVGILTPETNRAAWYDLIVHFGIECFDEYRNQDNTEIIITLAQDVFGRSLRLCKKVIDFDDMIFAPLYFNVTFDRYDWVLIDEAQDTNASRREMAGRMLKQQGRLVAVGDRHQAIFGFTGADAKALDLIADQFNAVRLPLTTTFRCPKAVVVHAQQWVNHIQAHETAPDGIVRPLESSELQKEVKVGDVILCRFNAPLITYVYQLIAAGIPARVEGREIGAGLKQLTTRWKLKTVEALLAKLEKFLENEVKKFEEKENHKAIEAVTDKVNCLRVIINRVISKHSVSASPQLVLDEIDVIFGVQPDGKVSTAPVVLLSSIHKAKGREWRKVFWLVTGPSGFARLPWELEQEDNLCYVAATRAMHELVLVNMPKK